MCEDFTNQLNEVPLKHFSCFFRLTHYSHDETNPGAGVTNRK